MQEKRGRDARAATGGQKLQAEWEAFWSVQPVGRSLAVNRRILRRIFRKSADLIQRQFRMPDGRQGLAVYLDGLVDESRLDRDLLRPLLTVPPGPPQWEEGLPTPGLPLAAARSLQTWGQLANEILDGGIVLLLDGQAGALTFAAAGWERRQVAEPETEPVIRGPKEGFIEDLTVNLSLIRRIIRSPRLKVETMELGRLTRTRVALIYMEGLIRPGVLREARSRLGRIQVDDVLDVGYLEGLIEDHPYSVFPQLLNTQRPDVVVGNLLEGRFAVLCAGSPHALIAPVSFWSFFQASEDYYERYWLGSFLRGLRLFLALLALTLPSFWVAILTFHQELLPTSLALTVARTREGVPFPSVVEALLMEVAFEALREAGLRLPKVVGQAVSIVGALVIGEAAVRAGLVSAPQVIIVATTGIASFAVPRFSGLVPVRLLRFPILLMAGAFGLLGISIAGLFIQIHVSSMRSFGLPYMAPWSPLRLRGLGDVTLRLPEWLRRRRPATARAGVRRRLGAGARPQPPGATRGARRKEGTRRGER